MAADPSARMRAMLIARALIEPLHAGGDRHVRTPAGVRHYNQPIGSVIRKDVVPRVGKAIADLSPAKSRDQRLDEMAATLNRRAIEAEPEVSKILQTVTAHAGGHMEGFAFRFKKPETIAKKVKDKTDKIRRRGVDTSDEEQAAGIGDALRYTSVIDAKRNVAAAKQILAELQAAGHTVERIKNTWPKGDDYSGINVKMRAPNGLPWELQFHTPDSYQTKEFGTHKDYAIYRDPDQSLSERAFAYLRMVKLWKDIEQPVGWENFGEILFERPDLR